MKIILTSLFSLFIVCIGWGQVGTLRFMHYNVLMFPDANPNKAFRLRPIVNYLQPDIISVNELTAQSGIDSLMKYALDTSKYAPAPWIADGTLISSLFYNKQRVGILRAYAVASNPRKTFVYQMYYKDQDFTLHPDTIKFRQFVVHLKSSQGTDNEFQRAEQTGTIRWHINQNVDKRNCILAGDFNMYTSNEEAYQNLLLPGSGQFFDPIDRPGNWSNNSSFSDIHTQSPRTTSFDNGVTGGMDDRFDFIMTTEDIIDGRYGMRYLPNSYVSVGNDGNHFNKSIIEAPTNNSVPDSVLQALHLMSDHIPVIMDVEFDPANAFNGIYELANTSCNFTPELLQQTAFKKAIIASLDGKLIFNLLPKDSFPKLAAGIYLISVITENNEMCRQKWAVID
jgi:hypothetical protein